MQNVVPSIVQVGSLLQWSADTTEHAHIEVVKDPASTTNNHNYDAQICWCLNCYEKCWIFDTAFALHVVALPDNEGHGGDVESDDKNNGDTTRNVLDDIWAPTRKASNFFDITTQLSSPPNFVPLCPHYTPYLLSWIYGYPPQL